MVMNSSAAKLPSPSGERGAAAVSASGQEADRLTTAAQRKRNPPGMPDPDAEVVVLSPEALMATNRFVCEVCNKGFPRDQNLQLHRREHKLPWNLRGAGKRSRKRVYVCPVSTCVYHDPGRALGDLTGIKKHFFRKHGGERKYGCDNCSKKYAVLSDWQAHVRTCSGASENGNSDFTPVLKRKQRVPRVRNSSKEQSSTMEVLAVSNLGPPTDQGWTTSSLSQPVVTPVFQLQQLPATQVTPEQQHQQQGQLVLTGYLLFYDSNPQVQASTAVGK